MSNAPVLQCSFCGKTQHEVRKLIASPSAHICNECVMLSLQILVDEARPQALAPVVDLSPIVEAIAKVGTEIVALRAEIAKPKPGLFGRLRG